MKLKLHSYIIILLFITRISYSQTYIYKHFGVDEGLPSSEVYEMYQDKQGYIWFATDKGLSRFNGYEFKNFTIKDGLPDNTILNLYPQKNGQIFCYAYQSQSLFYFDDVFNGFKEYPYNDILKKELQKSSTIKNVILDEKNTLYISGYVVNGLLEISKEGKIKKHFFSKDINKKRKFTLGIRTKGIAFFTSKNNLISTKETSFFKLKNNLSSRSKAISLNKNQFIFIDKNLGLAKKGDSISYYNTTKTPIGIKRINNDSFFVGYYNNGAEIRNVSGKIIKKFLPNKSVTNFLIDKEGSYWFSTLNDGVFYVKNPDIQVFTKEHVSSLVKDYKTLYLGLNNGDIINISKNRIDTLYKSLNINPAFVEFDKKNNHFYGYSDHKLINYTDKKKIFFNYVRKIPENIGGKLLKSSTRSFSKIEKNNIVKRSLNYNIQDVCAYNNDVLIATSDGLLIEKNNKILSKNLLNILKLRIDDIDVNQKTNNAYMATQGAGVIIYGNETYSINETDGLTNNIVSEVHIENDSTIWACTNSGLNKITFTSNKIFNITTITKADGLLSNDIDDVEIINDTVWVATKKGLCFFKKKILKDKSASKLISFLLKEINVNNTIINKKNVSLSYNQNNISFNLQAISHRNTSKIKYLYRLKEIDTNWVSTSNRNIRFSSLSPGSYTFQSKTSISNNHLITYPFKILPPFWKSWWFNTICVLFILGLIYLFFKLQVLSYNKTIIRELIRLIIKKLKQKETYFYFRSNGEDVKIPTHNILYVKSQGNYLDIINSNKTYTIRCKIGDFIASTPDSLEYLRVHRSYIIRIDQVTSKGKNWVVIKDQKIPVGETYLSELEKIHF